MEQMRVKAIQHIERKFKALRTFQTGLSRIQIEKNQCTILGLMSLAKELDLITTEEYESYYEELFNS